MNVTRRRTLIVFVSLSLGWIASPTLAQYPRSRQRGPQTQTEEPASPIQKDMRKRMLKASFEELGKESEKLMQLATELKDEARKASEDTLSLTVIRKAEEIESLAKKIKNRMKIYKRSIATQRGFPLEMEASLERSMASHSESERRRGGLRCNDQQDWWRCLNF